MGDCPHCGAGIIVMKGDRAKVRTNIVVLHKSGDVEVNCPACRQPVLIPCQILPGEPIRKSEHRPRMVVPLQKVTLDRTKPPTS